ncbi:MFS transporter [Desulfobulbus oligotrophicus]|uniref:MFS transporter n=1 Tax=Desulfobulbus oligotrophicus TaxID=1909699 RepID=A0A7T6AR14_9BACT|nr:MFS transporter [Desulfobulbus oligotrophicus]QQG66383.1 MFS transporter [Desulfobulbus oligotrophicus]
MSIHTPLHSHGTLSKIYFCTVITFCSLYAAQPIQPVFQHEFSLTSFQAILFTTLMMLPLGFAPMFYGVLLERLSARLIVRTAVLFLGVLELVFSLTNNYFVLLALRGLQGLAIPAILTSLVSYISFTASREDVQAAIARYIAATILGGFLGRFLSGLFTDLFGWRFFFFLLGVLLLWSFFLLRTLEKDANLEYSRPSGAEVIALVRQPQFFWLYCTIFSVFFVFAGLLNFLPFQLKAINPSFRETGIGFMYFGYVMGILVSLNVRWLIRLFGSETKVAMSGLFLYIFGILGFMLPDHRTMFIAMFVFCTGMFMAHSLLSGYINTLAKSKKGIANGVYISFYYLGGTIGSFAPGVFYEHFGWRVFLGSLIVMVFGAIFCLQRLRWTVAQIGSQPTGEPSEQPDTIHD